MVLSGGSKPLGRFYASDGSTRELIDLLNRAVCELSDESHVNYIGLLIRSVVPRSLSIQIRAEAQGIYCILKMCLDFGSTDPEPRILRLKQILLGSWNMKNMQCSYRPSEHAIQSLSALAQSSFIVSIYSEHVRNLYLLAQHQPLTCSDATP